MSYNCCPKHLQGLLNTLWLIQCLASKCHLSFSANSWSFTNIACKVQLSSPTIYIEQVHLIPGKTAERTGCTQFMPCFYCPQHLGKKKKICRCDRRHPSSKSLGSCVGSSPGSASTDRGSWWFLFHASVTLSLFLGCQRKLIFQISGADVRVTKGEPDGHQRGQCWEWITIQKKRNRNNNKSAKRSKEPASWLQKLKHKSPASLGSLLSNKETNSGLKRKTVKLEHRAAPPLPPPCSGLHGVSDAAGGETAADVNRGAQAGSANEIILSLFYLSPFPISFHLSSPNNVNGLNMLRWWILGWLLCIQIKSISWSF